MGPLRTPGIGRWGHPESDSMPEVGGRMPLVAHLEELRTRLLRSVGAHRVGGRGLLDPVPTDS
ncbi:MAG: hypothetical protein Ct9H300mP12_13770 [Acidimicrobiales bacterium]|nr:MAG: hypothetical protein Ct9H300mP12_13770 [Acidimicrobiales bacterium]